MLASLIVSEDGAKGNGEQVSVRGIPWMAGQGCCGVESEGVMQIPLCGISDFSQHWTGASFVSWSSSEYPECCIAPGGVSERKFSLGLTPGSGSIGCSVLPPPHPEIHSTHIHTHTAPST